MKGLIIDQDTGEVVGTFDDGDKILKKNTIEYLKNNVKIPKEEQFTKMYRESISILTECSLTGAEYAIVLYLASNLRYQSNIAKYDNGKLINRDNLQRDTQLNAETVKRAIRRLIGFGILVEVASTAGKVFIMNPFIFNVGDTIEKTVYDLFKKTKWCRWG